MKKKIIISIIIILLIIGIVLIYNYTHKSGTMICTYKSITDAYEIKSRYEIKYKNRIVEKLYSKEEFRSNNKKMLKEYKTSLELMYSSYNKIKYYDNKVSLKKDKLTTETTINYKKINKDKMISIDEENRSLYKNGKVYLKTMKNNYKNNGARCIYK